MRWRIAPAAAVLGATLLAGCWPAPGKGAKAGRGYLRAQPVIAALARYRADTGSWPDSLAQLTPRWLSPAALVPPTRPQEHYPFEYQRTRDGYRLRFRYVGPGMNECDFQQPPGSWECGGRF